MSESEHLLKQSFNKIHIYVYYHRNYLSRQHSTYTMCAWACTTTYVRTCMPYSINQFVCVCVHVCVYLCTYVCVRTYVRMRVTGGGYYESSFNNVPRPDKHHSIIVTHNSSTTMRCYAISGKTAKLISTKVTSRTQKPAKFVGAT